MMIGKKRRRRWGGNRKPHGEERYVVNSRVIARENIAKNSQNTFAKKNYSKI
jgi:hypothetical protein